MNKFAKLAVIVLVLGLITVGVRYGMKKGGDAEVTQEQPTSDGAEKESTAAAGSGADDSGAGSDMFPSSAKSRKGTAGMTGDAAGTAGGGLAGAPGVAGGPEVEKLGAPSKNHPDSNCFSFEYRHTKAAQDKDIEDFLDYSNAFPVFHDQITSKSVCVKVNGKPVAHKVSKHKGQTEVVIGSVVGPESVIKLSYCVGTSTCKEACAVKSNRFMDDLMSDAGDEDEFKESWGEAAEQKKELKAKVKEFRGVASANKELQKQSTVRVWDTVQKNDWVCKK